MHRDLVIAILVANLVVTGSGCASATPQPTSTPLSSDSQEPSSTPSPVPTDAPSPSNTPLPTDTPTPTATLVPRSWQEVWVQCRQDKASEEFLVEADGRLTVGDVVADPGLSGCYGATVEEKAINVGAALESQGGIAGELSGGWTEAPIWSGIYKLFLALDSVEGAGADSTGLTIVEPTPTPTPTATPLPLPTSTPDSCYGATAPGARERLTYEQLVACLGTPSEVVRCTANNVTYRSESENEYVPPKVVWERGADDCDGFAIFQCGILEARGWDAYMIGLSVDNAIGHNVCAVNLSEGRILVLDDGYVAGTFDSLGSVARHYIERGSMVENGSLRTIRVSAIPGPTTDHTSPTVLGLPWTHHQY